MGIKTRSITTGCPAEQPSNPADEADFLRLGVENIVAAPSLAFNLPWRRDNKALFPDIKEVPAGEGEQNTADASGSSAF